MKKLLTTLFILNCILFNVQSQTLSTNPTHLKWSQLKSNHFKVIYPQGMDSIARYTAFNLEKNYGPVSQSFGPNPRPISIIIQNQTFKSNGFVTLTPRQSEFFITPPQDYVLLGNNHWFDLLATHEYRHVAQLDKSLKTLSNIGRLVFGGFGQDFVNSISMPNWLLEGDAVGTETAFSQSGRGRIPQFNQLFRAQIMEFPKKLTYSQITAGSYNHGMPNHYIYGNHLTSYLKQKYGYDVWNKVTEDQFVFPFIPFGFSKSVKNFAGKSIDKVFTESIADYKKEIEAQQINTTDYQQFEIKTNPVKRYTSYSYPQAIGNGEVLAIKTGLDHIDQIVKIKNGIETKMYAMGQWNDANMFSANDSIAVWAEFNADLRWRNRNYSVIKILDLKTKKVRSLLENTRWTAPAVSPDGQSIAVVETNKQGKHSLLIVNTATGYILQTIQNAQNAFFQHPAWDKKDNSIVVVEQLGKEKSIVRFDLKSSKKSVLIEPSVYDNLACPAIYGNQLFFNNAHESKEYVMMKNLETGLVYKVSNGKYGSYNANIDMANNQVLFNDFTRKGTKIVALPLNQLVLEPVQIGINEQPVAFGKWMIDEAKSKELATLNPEVSSPKNYSKWNIFNVFNWGPNFVSNYGTGFNLSVMSQDKLSTTALEAGLTYDSNEQKFNKFVGLVYEGFYPTLSLTLERNNRSTAFAEGTLKPGEQTYDTWQENVLNFGIGLPFTIQKSKYTTVISPKLSFLLNKGLGYDLKTFYLSQVAKDDLVSHRFSLVVNRSLNTSKRDVDVRMGQSLVFYNTQTFDNQTRKGKTLGLNASLNFPLLLPHDRLKIGYSFNENYTLQSNSTATPYIYSAQLPQARGYESTIFRDISKFSLDYKFILADVDFSLTRIMHFQRFMLNPFLDQSKVSYRDNKGKLFNANLNSIGIDLTTKVNFMRLPFASELGIRAVYAPDQTEDQKFQVFPLILSLGF